MNIRPGAGDAISIMNDGENTGVKLESFVRQNLQRPQRLASDGKTGSAIGPDWLAQRIFQGALRLTQIRAKFRRRLPVHKMVPKAMGSDRVTCRLNSAYQLRKALGHPA